MSKISAIIITLNETVNIADCLDSLAFCDERIVVDGGSKDDTVNIARQCGARVFENSWQGFGAQKNFALAQARHDWVLSIDADERVSDRLAEEIIHAADSDAADGYLIPRQSNFCGRPMRHSGWWPDYSLRLFRRSGAKFSDKLVHERVLRDGTVNRLSEPLLHQPVWRIEDAVRRMDQYSTASAEEIVNSGRKISFITGITHGIWTFVRTYFLRRGFLDGPEGLLLAVANAEGSYYRYMKAWLATRRTLHPLIQDSPLASGVTELKNSEAE